MSDNCQQQKTGSVCQPMRPNKFAKFELDYGRIERLVDETVNKLTLAMTVPNLVDNDFELIKSHLTQDQLEMLKRVFGKYIPSESICLSKKTTVYAKLSCMQTLDKIEEYFNSYSTKTENIPQRDEYDFSSALELLYSNEAIRKISNTNRKRRMSEAGFNFLQDMKLFLYSVVDKLKLSPLQAETRDAYLRKLCQHQHQLTDEAHILEEEAIEEIKSTEELLKTKLNDVLIMKKRSDGLLEECRNYIQKLGTEANKKMIFNWKNSEHEQEILEEKVQKQMVDLEMLRKKYVDEEKELRTKRYKTEQHLISFLEQYDKDMQNKQNELDMQNEVAGAEKEQYDDLIDQFKEQEVIYEMIMKEKAEYEQRLFEAKLYELKCAASARKIQRFYRNFKRLVRIAGKKDLLKKQKRRKK